MGFDQAGAPARPADDAVAVLIAGALPVPAAFAGRLDVAPEALVEGERVCGSWAHPLCLDSGEGRFVVGTVRSDGALVQLVYQAQCQDFQQQIAGADGKVKFQLMARDEINALEELVAVFVILFRCRQFDEFRQAGAQLVPRQGGLLVEQGGEMFHHLPSPIRETVNFGLPGVTVRAGVKGCFSVSGQALYLVSLMLYLTSMY